MFNLSRILLPIDFSEQSRIAAQQAGALARHFHSEITLLHVSASGGYLLMAPLYNPATQRPEDARFCIDQFEFPDIPTVYPVVWVKAREAAEVCSIMGKRLCDAHEWEGACAGSLEPPDYLWTLAQGLSPAAAIERMQIAHNKADSPNKSWSYGPTYQKGVCAASSQKTPGCDGGGWTKCGSNTFPAGNRAL